MSAARLRHLVCHVNASLASKVCAATETCEYRQQVVRHFWKGVLAHLLIVPPWILPPAGLLGGLVAAGMPFGGKGALAMSGIGGVLVADIPKVVRALVCAAIMGMATAKRQSRAILGALVATILCFLGSISDGSIPRIPGLFNYVSRWAPHYYKETKLRGALDDIRPGGKNFFGFHPHGCLCAGFTINGTYNPEFMKHAGRTLWLCDSGLRRRNPGFRMMAEAYEAEDRAIEAGDPSDFRKFMSRGETLCFLPGGFLDAVVFEHGVDVVYLSTKKGFVKYCLQFGYRLHPVYTFGERDTYYTFKGLKSLRIKIAKNNVPALAFFGWPLLPMLPLPSARLITYVGRGIDVPHIQEPTEEEVDHWHSVYTEALRQLFEEKKAEAGFPDAQLQLV